MDKIIIINIIVNNYLLKYQVLVNKTYFVSYTCTNINEYTYCLAVKGRFFFYEVKKYYKYYVIS